MGGGKRHGINHPSFPVLAVKGLIPLAAQVVFWQEVKVLLSLQLDACPLL